VRRKKKLSFLLDVELFKYDNQSAGETLYPYHSAHGTVQIIHGKRGVISMAGIAKWRLA